MVRRFRAHFLLGKLLSKWKIAALKKIRLKKTQNFLDSSIPFRENIDLSLFPDVGWRASVPGKEGK